MKIALFIANGTEETEAIATLDVLRRAELHTDLISIAQTKEITSAHHIKIIADTTLELINISDYDALVFPGGLAGMEQMRDNVSLIQAIKDFNENNKIIAAICASPAVLGKAGILKNVKATCYPSFQNELLGAKISEQGVCIDGNIITAKSVAYSLEFGLKIVEKICGKDKSEQIAKQMYLKKN